MRVFYSTVEVPRDLGPSVVAIGNFDGVHQGHSEIMHRVVQIGREHGWTPTVLTFDPHPARVLAPERAPKLIMTLPQRLKRLQQEGIESVLVIPFSKEFATLTPEEFVERVLVGVLHGRCVLVGEDFRFGYRQTGDIQTLRLLGERFGFELQPVLAITGKGDRISSTRIRRLVESGKVSAACRMMGEPFTLEGKVVSGQGIGSKQTVPTLNLKPENDLLPAVGVYATRTRWEPGVVRKSITNVGYRPTFDGEGLTVEAFLLDDAPFETPARIQIEFLAFVRGERKFETPQALKAQILRDAAAVQRFHRRVDRLRVG